MDISSLTKSKHALLWRRLLSRVWAGSVLQVASGPSGSSGPVTPEGTLAATPSHVSPQELIALRGHVNGIKLETVGAAKAAMAGVHASRFRGRGMDYQESRSYQAGDDVRHMDWRVTARAGKPHVKLYEEERERPVVILVDCSPSMFFGTRGSFKSVQAARVAAFLAWATVARGDRVGALMFNGRHVELQPRGSSRAALQLIKDLVEMTNPETGMLSQPEPDALSDALKRLRRVARPGSLVFVLSDFYAMNDEAARQLSRLRLHNDVVAIQFADVLELEAPPSGRYLTSDGEKVEVLDTRSGAARNIYQHWAMQRQDELEAALQKCRVPLLRLTTENDIVAELRAWFSPAAKGANGSRAAAKSASAKIVVEERS